MFYTLYSTKDRKFKEIATFEKEPGKQHIMFEITKHICNYDVPSGWSLEKAFENFDTSKSSDIEVYGLIRHEPFTFHYQVLGSKESVKCPHCGKEFNLNSPEPKELTNEEVIEKLLNLGLKTLTNPYNCSTYKSPELYLEFLVIELKSEIMYCKRHEKQCGDSIQDLAKICKAFNLHYRPVKILVITEQIAKELEDKLGVVVDDSYIGDPLLPLLQELTKVLPSNSVEEFKSFFNAYFSKYIQL